MPLIYQTALVARAHSSMNLTGKHIVVTGAAGRLGRRLVRHFAHRGATIAAIVRSEEEAHDIPFPEEAEGWAYPADVTREDLAAACFQQIGAQFGHVDALIHTVGGWESRPFLETSLSDWEGILRVNLTSAFLCFREAARLMQGRGGRLIGIASAQGADRGAAQQAAYSAAKAGIVRLVETVSAELEEEGVTAHAIAPSTILFDGPSDGRGVEADEIVRLCEMLCSPAGQALNGATLRAYGRGA